MTDGHDLIVDLMEMIAAQHPEARILSTLRSRIRFLLERVGPSDGMPSEEAVAAEVHAAWMRSKQALGITTRKSESGEELMVPYAMLSEAAKELDRATVRAVREAESRAGGHPCG